MSNTFDARHGGSFYQNCVVEVDCGLGSHAKYAWTSTGNEFQARVPNLLRGHPAPNPRGATTHTQQHLFGPPCSGLDTWSRRFAASWPPVSMTSCALPWNCEKCALRATDALYEKCDSTIVQIQNHNIATVY